VIASHQSELDLPQADDIKINDTGPVMLAAGDKIELVPMAFAFPPARHGGAPVFNFRSEGRQIANSNRCLIPASGFFEFTGKKYPTATRCCDGAGRKRLSDRHRDSAGAAVGSLRSRRGRRASTTSWLGRGAASGM
jgi:putative SOS response-associated peptidase YedK